MALDKEYAKEMTEQSMERGLEEETDDEGLLQDKGDSSTYDNTRDALMETCSTKLFSCGLDSFRFRAALAALLAPNGGGGGSGGSGSGGGGAPPLLVGGDLNVAVEAAAAAALLPWRDGLLLLCHACPCLF